MAMQHLLVQYEEQLKNVRRQLKDLEKNGETTTKKYVQLKQMRRELQLNIRQIKSYIK